MLKVLKLPDQLKVALQQINNQLRLNVQSTRGYCGNVNSTKNIYSQKIQRSRKMDPNLKIRPDPVVVKLKSPEFKSMLTKNLLDLMALFSKNNFEIRVAGGAVRDLLMNKVPNDIDFATTATPQQMIQMFTEENIRMINTNGERHGTITARINDEENFEVTTLRIDVVTDGRRAEVEFTTDWILDANRRDLTFNSMFLGFDGSVYDWFYGYEDLQKRRVAFVGDANRRIQEDYLRILRYFRFYGRIAEHADRHEPSTLEAITTNIGGLERISGERIWGELQKILKGNFSIELLNKMLQCDAGQHMGLPSELDLEELNRIKDCIDISFQGIPFHPVTIISSLLRSTEDARILHLRLKFSAYERDLAIFLTQNKSLLKDINQLLPYQRICFQTAGRPGLMKEYVLELLKYTDKRALYDQLLAWTMPKFPVTGKMIIDNGCPPGKTVSVVMQKLREIWYDHEFKIGHEELLKSLPQILGDLDDKKTSGGVQNKTIKKNK